MEGTTYPQAVCPRCQKPHLETVLNSSMSTLNLLCEGCGKKFCSFCGKGWHYFGPCGSSKKL